MRTSHHHQKCIQRAILIRDGAIKDMADVHFFHKKFLRSNDLQHLHLHRFCKQQRSDRRRFDVFSYGDVWW